MFVGLARVTIALGQSRSLKEKRSAVRRIVDRVRSRFSVSIAEVSSHDHHQVAVLGISLVGSEGRDVHTMLDEVLRSIEALYVAPMVDADVRVVAFDDFDAEVVRELPKGGPNALTREFLAGDPGPEPEPEDAPWAAPEPKRQR